MNRKVRLAFSLMCLLPFLYSVQGAPVETKDKVEKDRAAILAMAGEYEVTFKFMETVAIGKDYELKKPYLAEATEIVFVVKNSPKNIILQHVLWLEDLERVVKHWKQEWRFEDKILHEFIGDNTWSRRELSDEEVSGTWTQKVYQVDDSPRYESYGRWSHEGGMSSWQGSKTRRPLPRREYTKQAKTEAENAKISLRNARRDGNNQLKEFLKEKVISEDEERQGEEEMQKLTDLYVHKVDELLTQKEKDLLDF